MEASETSVSKQVVTIDEAAHPMLTIVIPAFNEAARIGDSIKKIGEFARRFPLPVEVVVIDDGSADQTAKIVSDVCPQNLRLFRNAVNHGKGYSVRQGFLEARGEYVLFTDADLSAPIDEINKLLNIAIEQRADIVIGSRAVDRRYIEKHQSRSRELGGMGFNLMVRMLLGLRLRDTQCGFKLFNRAKTRPVFEKLTIAGFGFDPELLFLAKRSGLTIREVPVRWSHSEGSKVRFVRDGIRMFTDLVRIRFNDIAGRYS